MRAALHVAARDRIAAKQERAKTMAFFEGGSPANYTIGGGRFWFSELLDATTDPQRFAGNRDFGNVVEHEFEQEIDELEHFTSKTGTRRKDRTVVREISASLLLTLDELSIKNVRDFFQGGEITDQAAAVGGGAVVDEIQRLDGEEIRILGKSLNGTAIVVDDITGATTFTAGVDYGVVDVIGGYKAIKRIPAGAIGDGDFVRVNYTFDIRENKSFAPSAVLERKGSAVFFGVSDTGNEFIYTFENVQIIPEGSFALDDEEFSQLQIRVDILDDSTANPNFPFGLFEHFGTGQDL